LIADIVICISDDVVVLANQRLDLRRAELAALELARVGLVQQVLHVVDLEIDVVIQGERAGPRRLRQLFNCS